LKGNKMSLLLNYYGQNIGVTVPNVTLVGDPGVDQATLTAAGFLGGRIMALVGENANDRQPLISPCNALTQVPYATLINGPGEFSGSIGPSGSKKAPVVRAMWDGQVTAESFVAAPTAAYTIGNHLYCGTGSNAGLWTADVPASGNIAPTGICTHAPTASEPWLGVSSLL
jgi:hypothetical protein